MSKVATSAIFRIHPPAWWGARIVLRVTASWPTPQTRGTLKKRFPTCTQPTAKKLAAAEAFQKKQQEIHDANAAKANPQAPSRPSAAATAEPVGRPTPPKNAEERAIRRCVSSGRLPATCTGNSLLGAFGKMVGEFLPSANKESAPGPEMRGIFEGAGKWRLDFIDDGVLVNCAFLSPDQHSYTDDFKNRHTILTIDTTPKPLVLTIRPDGAIFGPGPVLIDGVIATGYDSGYRDQSGKAISPTEAAQSSNPVYDSNGNRVSHSGALPGHATFSHRQASCPALNLSSKGASTGVQTMATDLLKSLFNDGDKGPPVPPGIRMHGIFAASTGFSVQFFPESAILGCGPDSARAYPYTVGIDGAIKIGAPDHPLTFAFGPNGSLDPGTGTYQVHGRTVVGADDKGDFTFASLEQSCSLGVLLPSKTIPMTGGTVASPTAIATEPGGDRLSTPTAPLGNATLTVISGFPAPNPLAGRPYVLLRDSYANALAKGGVPVPAGMSPYKYVGTTCSSRTPDCQKVLDAIKIDSASAVRADANGAGTFPGVPPGTYYLMTSARYNNQSLIWGQALELKAGANSIKLDGSNAIPVN